MNLAERLERARAEWKANGLRGGANATETERLWREYSDLLDRVTREEYGDDYNALARDYCPERP